MRALAPAFRFAKQGGDARAVELWDEAIEHGYEPSRKTLNNQQIEIKKGLKADVRLGSTSSDESVTRDVT